MPFRTVALASLGLLLAAPALADHTEFVVQMKGQILTNDGDDVVKTKVTTESFLTSPDNFLVVEIDAIPENIDFDIEEWEDTNADGIPDARVDRDPDEVGIQSLIFQARTEGGAMAALENGAFSAVLAPVDVDWDDDGNSDFDGALVLDGKLKTKTTGGGEEPEVDQVGFKAKVSGPINDADRNVNPSSIFKGSIKSVELLDD